MTLECRAKPVYLALSSIYLAGMIWVWAGVFLGGGSAHLDLFAIFALSAVLWFVIAWIALPRLASLLPLPSIRLSDGVALGLLVAALLASIGQYLSLGQIPMVSAARSSDYIEIAKIRQSINDGPPVFNYLSPLLVKVVYPVLTIRFFQRGRFALAALVLLLGMAFGASLMQKSFPLYVAVPVSVYLALSRRFVAGACAGAAACVVIVAMTSIANPPDPADAIAGQGTVPLARKAIGAGLIHRILLVPGETVVEWFDAFPAAYPFEHGCGYRFAAPALGCDFVNNSQLVYLYAAPDYVAKGLKGARNAAHFAEEYANFGPAGLALSPFLAALAILLASALTSVLGFEMALPVNAPFILALTSSALHTTLLSGGWAAAIALSLILLRPGVALRRLRQ